MTPRSGSGRFGNFRVDLALATVFAVAWLSAVAATCLTLWFLVGLDL